MRPIAVLALFSALPFQAGAAAIVLDYLGGDIVTSGWEYTGQTFTAPLGINILSSWEFEIAGGTGTLDFEIREWDGSIGTLLYSDEVTWPTVTGVVALNGLNLGVSPGETYIALYHVFGHDSILHEEGNVYAGGSPSWGETLSDLETNFPFNVDTLEHSFRATFDVAAVPEPATGFTLALASAALLFARRLTRRQ